MSYGEKVLWLGPTSKAVLPCSSAEMETQEPSVGPGKKQTEPLWTKPIPNFHSPPRGNSYSNHFIRGARGCTRKSFLMLRRCSSHTFLPVSNTAVPIRLETSCPRGSPASHHKQLQGQEEYVTLLISTWARVFSQTRQPHPVSSSPDLLMRLTSCVALITTACAVYVLTRAWNFNKCKWV